MERALLEAIESAAAAGEQAAVATVIATIRSAPRRPGAKLVVTEGGRLVGSVSGGCVEADVAERARALFAGAPPELVHYGVADETAWEVGLACGGEIDVFLDRADPPLWRSVRELLEAEQEGTLFTDTRTGAKRLEPGSVEQTRLRDDGVFVEGVEPPLRLVVFGATDTAEHLCAFGRQLGWRTIVVDTRPGLLTRERIPSAGELVEAWPDEVGDRVDSRTAVVSTTHEERLDLPALATALRGGARYVGAIGSRRTQECRRAALAAQGFTQAELDRIHGPAGLDLGGPEPAEIALAIAAEIVGST